MGEHAGLQIFIQCVTPLFVLTKVSCSDSCNVPYVGKIWRGKILANGVQIAKFFHANSYKYSEITEDLPADSPKFSSPFDSSVMIRQNFPPPKFSHVRYTYLEKWIMKINYNELSRFA